MAARWDATLHSKVSHTILRGILSNDHEHHLDHILKELVPADCMSRLKSLGQLQECDHANTLVEVAVNGPSSSWSQTSVLFLCTLSSWAHIRALVQLLSLDGFAFFGACDARVETDGNAAVTFKHLNCTDIPFTGHCNPTSGLLWFHVPLKYSHPFKWLAGNNFGLKVAKVLFQPLNVGNSGNGLLKNSEVVLKSNFRASCMVFGSDTVHTFNLMTAMCQLSASCDSEVARTDLSLKDSDGTCPQTSDTVEITDEDFLTIKKNVKNEDEESEQNSIPDSVEGSLVALCERYNKVVRRGRFQFPGPERMLIVQCPGCLAEFRGLSDRMFRLVRHIQTHGPQLCEQYMKVIAKRYRPVFDVMRKRMNLSK